mgnify:CR=1 FL=1
MILFPAIDLIGGKAVRLIKGDYAQMTVYSETPHLVAKDFEKEVKKVDEHIDELLYKINKPRPQKVGELVELIKSTQEN